MTVQQKPLVFACGAECASEMIWNAGYTDLEVIRVLGAEDVVGQDVRGIDLIVCRHRKHRSVNTAYMHVEACLMEYGLHNELGK